MMDKNPQARTLAFKRCVGKLKKIKELGITPDMSEDQIEEMIERLATAKAAEKEVNLSEVVSGQRWYVTDLVHFSGLTHEEQLEAEYNNSFAETASEAEMIKAMAAIAA